VPLTASSGDHYLLAPVFSPDSWVELKKRRPRPVLSCGETAIAKTSRLGTQFFAHKVLCDVGHKGESPQHLRLKTAIVRAAAELGWHARAEIRAPDGSWIADVLVEKGGRRVAFEVQIASQDLDRYRERQARYARDGVECFWLTSRSNTDHLAGVPALRVDPNADELVVAHRSRVAETFPLEGFVEAVLDGALRWAPAAPASVTGAIRWGVHACDSCRLPSVVWDVEATAVATCADCSRRRPTQPIYGGHAPKAAAARLGLVAPAATWHGRDPGVPSRFSCGHCRAGLRQTDLGWLMNGMASVTSTAPIPVEFSNEGHWCTSGFDLRRPADVVLWLRDERLAAPTPSPGSPLTAHDLLRDAADRQRVRLERAEEAKKVRADAERREAATALRLRQFEASLPVVDPASRGMPPLAGPKASSDHERTAAIDAYVLAQPHQAYTTDELLPLFPRFTERCTCRDCDSIKKTYLGRERQELFPRLPR
jgi:hypothetical protein